MAEDPFDLVGETLDGKYRVDAVVAQGGFGVVYRAVHLALKRAVAVKVLLRQGDGPTAELILAQFKAEAELLAKLDHPAIVQVLDLGVATMPSGDSAPWMTLEWVDGRTLADALKERARSGEAGRDPAACMAILRPVFEAVAQAHALGIAHRDLKPANIMLVDPASAAPRSSARPMVRLLDFGIAKALSADELRPSDGETDTRSGNLSAFSMRYAAPEQIGAARTGPWTDVHALGLILTQMLVGRAPYRGVDGVTVATAALSPARPTPASHGVGVGAWEPVLARALSLRPADRPQDAGALLRLLTEALPDATYTPAPESDPASQHTSTEALLAAPRRGHATEPVLEVVDEPSAPSDAPVSRPQRSEPPPTRPRAPTRWITAAAAGLSVAALLGWIAWPRAPVATSRVAATPVTHVPAAPSVAAPTPAAPPVVAPPSDPAAPAAETVTTAANTMPAAGANVVDGGSAHATSAHAGPGRRVGHGVRDAGGAPPTVEPVTAPW